MATDARHDFSVWRNDDLCTIPLRIIGPDLGSVIMRMQIRPTRDNPTLLADLSKVADDATTVDGLRVVARSVAAGVTTTDIVVQLTKATRQAFGYDGAVGSDTIRAYAFLLGGVTRLWGDLRILASAYGADNAPSQRSGGSAAVAGSGGASDGLQLTLAGDDITALTLDGVELLAPMVDVAQTAATAAAASAALVVPLADAINSLTVNTAQVADDSYAWAVADPVTGAVLLGVKKDGSVPIPGLIPNEVQVMAPTSGEAVDLLRGVIDRAGRLIWGYTTSGRFITPEGELRRWQQAGFAVVTDPAFNTTGGIAGAGQSNGAAALSYGQTNRTPYPQTQVYPAGFSGAMDPPDTVTQSVVRGEFRTLFGRGPTDAVFPDVLHNVFLDDNSGWTISGTLGGESQYRAMGLRLLNQYPASRWVVSAANAEGGRSMSWLSCPTPAQIRAGVMPTSQGNVALPATSAEALNLAAGGTLADLWRYSDDQCATRFYKGARAHAAQAHLLAAEGRRHFIALVNISHGEDHSDGAAYQSLLRQYVLDLRRMAREITNQTVDPIVIFTVPGSSDFYQTENTAGYEAWKASGFDKSYEPGGANSKYKPDEQRSSDCWDQIINMRNLSDTMQNVFMGYARQWRETNIHSQPFVMRENGEYTAQLLVDAALAPAGRATSFAITGARISGASVFVTVRAPFGEDIEFRAPTATGKMTARAGMAYGFQYEVPDGNGGWTPVPLAEANVVIVDNTTICITPAVAPAAGHRLSYNVGSRTGALVTKGGPPALFNFQDGQPNVLTSRLLNHRQIIF